MKGKIPNLVVILILTTLTSVVWISLSIYRAVVVKPAEVIPDEISQTLDPNLNQDIINQIVNKND